MSSGESSRSYFAFTLFVGVAALLTGGFAGWILRMPQDEFTRIKSESESELQAIRQILEQERLACNDARKWLQVENERQQNELEQHRPRSFPFQRKTAMTHFESAFAEYRVEWSESVSGDRPNSHNWSTRIGNHGVSLICNGDTVTEFSLLMRRDDDERKLVNRLFLSGAKLSGIKWLDEFVETWFSAASSKLLRSSAPRSAISDSFESSYTVSTDANETHIEVRNLVQGNLDFISVNFVPSRGESK